MGWGFRAFRAGRVQGLQSRGVQGLQSRECALLRRVLGQKEGLWFRIFRCVLGQRVGCCTWSRDCERRCMSHNPAAQHVRLPPALSRVIKEPTYKHARSLNLGGPRPLPANPQCVPNAACLHKEPLYVSPKNKMQDAHTNSQRVCHAPCLPMGVAYQERVCKPVYVHIRPQNRHAGSNNLR